MINTLTCAGWAMSHDKPLGYTGVSLVIIGIVAGLALTFNERAIRIHMSKVAWLEATTRQATI